MSEKRLGGQQKQDQICLDLIVRNDPEPNINQATTQAVIAPASVASICAVEELPRAGGWSLGVGSPTDVSIGAGMMTRIWLDAGVSSRSVCANVLAAGGGLSTGIESTLLRSSVAVIFAGGTVFAVELVKAGIVGQGAAAGADPVSSVANCSTVSELARSSVAAGSTLGQATREFILSARRAGR